MSRASRPELVGQTLLIGFRGTDASAAEEVITRFRPGGLVLLPRNISSRQQLSDLTKGMQQIARQIGLPQLVLAVDQEGGSVQRLSSAAGFTDLPSAAAVGRVGSAAARAAAEVAARELASVGLNTNLAPVLDLATDPRNTVIGTRSYSADAAAVSEIAALVIAAHRRHGVLSVAKHFPGHGATAVDSHLDLPSLSADRREMEERHLVPFRRAVDAGVDAIMTAHVLSALDRSVPATLSHAVVTDALRTDIGYDGVVVADSLEMRALSRAGYAHGEAALAALSAGVDMLIFDGDEAAITAASSALNRHASDLRLAESWGRIERIKSRIGQPVAVQPLRATVADATQLAMDGLLVIDEQSILPLHDVPAVLDYDAGAAFGFAVGWRVVQVPPSDGSAVVAAIADEAASDALRAAVRSLCDAGRSVVVLSLGSMRTVADLPPATAAVICYDLPAGLWSPLARHLLGDAA